MTKVSIIIPVYNTEQYLFHCLDSILNQSFSDFELLLIDDGSSDGSGAICDVYSEKDNRIRVFHKENGGVSSIQSLVAHVGTDVDMVYGGIRKFDESSDTIETIAVRGRERISVEEALDAFVAPEERNGDWHKYLYNRIYRMIIIKRFGLRFKEEIYYKEDGLFVVQYLCQCENKVACIPDIVYKTKKE